jgi:hypothetical protein
MTMYLSSRDIRPTGYEPGEFIDFYDPPAADDAAAARPDAAPRTGHEEET